MHHPIWYRPSKTSIGPPCTKGYGDRKINVSDGRGVGYFSDFVQSKKLHSSTKPLYSPKNAGSGGEYILPMKKVPRRTQQLCVKADAFWLQCPLRLPIILSFVSSKNDRKRTIKLVMLPYFTCLLKPQGTNE